MDLRSCHKVSSAQHQVTRADIHFAGEPDRQPISHSTGSLVPLSGGPWGAGGPPLAGAGDCHLAGRGLRHTPRGGGGPPPGAGGLWGAPAPAAPRRHLNLPAPRARDPHRTPPSLSPHPGPLGPQPHAAARPAMLPPRGLSALTTPLTPSRAWPCPVRGRATAPTVATDSRPENTLVNPLN